MAKKVKEEPKATDPVPVSEEVKAPEEKISPVSPVTPEPPKEIPVAEPDKKPGSLRSIEDLFKDSWAIFAKGWVKYLLFSLLVAGIFIAGFIVYLIAAIAIGAQYISVVDNGLMGPSFDGNLLVLAVLIIIGVVLAVLVGTIFSLATNKLVYNVAEENNEGIKPALKYSWKNFLPYLLVAFMTGFFVLCGYILLIIPGIILTIFLSLITPIFVLENKRGFAVLKRSWNLVKGDFWPVFGRIMIIFALGVLLSTISQGDAFLSFASFILQFILTFFGIGYNYLIYKDLAKNK